MGKHFLQQNKEVYLHPLRWSGGRAARQRSAKPRTAVQIRFRPRYLKDRIVYNDAIFLFLSIICFLPIENVLWRNTETKYFSL